MNIVEKPTAKSTNTEFISSDKSVIKTSEKLEATKKFENTYKGVSGSAGASGYFGYTGSTGSASPYKNNSTSGPNKVVKDTKTGIPIKINLSIIVDHPDLTFIGYSKLDNYPLYRYTGTDIRDIVQRYPVEELLDSSFIFQTR